MKIWSSACLDFPPPVRELIPRFPKSRLFPLDGRQVYAYRFARAGIYHGLRVLGVGHGDEVLMPEYHHGVEVEAVRALGATVKYYPLHDDLSLDLEALQAALSPRTRMLYVTHYFGFPQPIWALRALCDHHGLLLLEDCALALFSESQGVPLGFLGDLSIFCLYETLPVPDGGILVFNRYIERHPRQARTLDARLLLREGWRLIRSLLEELRPRPEPEKNRLAFSLPEVPPKVFLEYEDVPEAPGFPWFRQLQLERAMSPFTRLALSGLALEEVRERRRQNFLFWANATRGWLRPVRSDLPEGVCPLLYPVRVEDKRRLYQALSQEGIEVHNWWCNWYGGAQPGELPRNDQLREQLLGLPVHQYLTSVQKETILSALRRHLRAA